MNCYVVMLAASRPAIWKGCVCFEDAPQVDAEAREPEGSARST
jgi:hypothetical protein